MTDSLSPARTASQSVSARPDAARPLRVLLVDPSLFTAPYDAALTGGLLSVGVEPTWAVRPVRPGDRAELAPERVDPFFYKNVDQWTNLPSALRAFAKGLAHGSGLATLVARAMDSKPDVVHFQWAIVPLLDALALLLLRRRCPVVITVHDTLPFNNDRVPLSQRLAFDLPIKLCDRVIVHTRAGRQILIRRGIPEEKVVVVPHGPLRLRAPSRTVAGARSLNARRTFVLFGEIKRYKGADVLIEAVGMLSEAQRANARFIVAGRPQMDITPLQERIEELRLGTTIEIWPRRLSEEEMADLFAVADCFVFPYRHIDASGVYFLVKSLSRWVIATRVGVFAEDLVDGVHGALVPPNDPRAMADALARAIEHPLEPKSRSPDTEWTDIGRATKSVYLQTRAGRLRGPRISNTRPPSRPAVEPSPEDGLERYAEVPTAMTRRTVLLAAPIAVGAVCVSRSGSTQSARTGSDAEALESVLASGYKLAKNWDFRTVIRSDEALRAEFHTRFVYAKGTLDHLGDEWERYRDNGNHLFTESGLSLVARLVGPLAPGSVESGMLRSRWTGKYGVFEARMKVPRGRGLWPAFWLNPEDQKWPPEIDVVEIVDNGPDATRGSFHFLHGVGAEGKETQSKLDRKHAYSPGVDYADGFHVFTAEWTPGRVRHFVDGAEIVERAYPWKHDDGTDGGPAHVLANLAVGGKWPGPPTTETRFPASLEIEYIRVWQR